MCVLSSLNHWLWAHKRKKKTLRENIGAGGQSLRNLSGCLRHQLQIGLGDNSKNFRKQRRHATSRIQGEELKTIQVDCDSLGFGDWNYYSESWNTQLVKAKLTLSVQDIFFSFKHKKTDFTG